MRPYNYYNASPAGYGSTQNLSRGRQSFSGSTTHIWRASNSNLSSMESNNEPLRYNGGMVNDGSNQRMYQTMGHQPRSESVNQEYFSDRQGNVDFQRTITRTSNFDKGGGPTLYSTNPYATWKRYSKPDLSTIGGNNNGGGSYPSSSGGSFLDNSHRRKMMFSSQTSLNQYTPAPAQNSVNTMYHHVNANTRSYSNPPAKNQTLSSISTQPVTVSFYTSNRQRNRITPRGNIESSMSYQPVFVPNAAPPSSNPPLSSNYNPPLSSNYNPPLSSNFNPPSRPMSVMGGGSIMGGNSLMGSRRSSVTSLDVTRPLQVSASHWQPIKSMRDEAPTLERPDHKSWQVGVYAKDLIPSSEQVRKMAQLVSQSLFDPRNVEAKGGRMFRRRQERAAQYTYEGYGRNEGPQKEYANVPSTLDDLREKAMEHKMERIARDLIQSGIPLPPNPEDLLNCARGLRHNKHNQQQQFSVYDPESGQHKFVRATNFDVDLSDDEPCEHNIVTPNVCNMIVRDLKGGRGRGSSMFQKRHEKSLRWVTDETNRREKSYGIVEAIKSGRVTEDSLEKSLSRMHQARPERLPSMTSVIKQISPWEAAAGGIPLESTMQSGAQIMAEAMSKASMLNDRRRVINPPMPTMISAGPGNRNLNMSQSSINTTTNDYGGMDYNNSYNTTGRGGYNDSGSSYAPSAAGSRPPSAIPFMPPKGGVAMPGLTGPNAGRGFADQRGGGFRSSLQATKEPKKWRPMNFNSSNLHSANSSSTMISAEL